MGLDISLAKIIAYEADDLCYLLVEESPELLPFFREYIRKKHFIYDDEEYDSEVFFYNELAYQRKGVIPSFYTDFINDVCLTRRDEVERLSNYIDLKHKASFVDSFINQFVEGQTIVIVGW
jgi:hypothetical protein